MDIDSIIVSQSFEIHPASMDLLYEYDILGMKTVSDCRHCLSSKGRQMSVSIIYCLTMLSPWPFKYKSRQSQYFILFFYPNEW